MPIAFGLGIDLPADTLSRVTQLNAAFLAPASEPKTHTIRAPRRGRSRHARVGEQLTLYCRQRHPAGFLIGRAVCDSVKSIQLDFTSETVKIDDNAPFCGYRDLDHFARTDSFDDWAAMREFWRETHAATVFVGFIIKWVKP